MNLAEIPDFNTTLEYLQFQYEREEDEEEIKKRQTRKSRDQRKKKTKKQKRNPLFVWEAIKYCISEKVRLPEWVEKYLESVSDELLAIKNPGNRAADIIKDALGFEGWVFDRHIKAEEKRQIFLLIEKERRKAGETDDILEIFADVAKKFQRLLTTRGKERYSDETIRKIYYEMKHLHDQDMNEDRALWREYIDSHNS
ncbi:MAG: hypothetical protein ACLQJ7_00350 [Syntrophobacteraceae bacterium]